VRICVANGWLYKDPFLHYKARLRDVERESADTTFSKFRFRRKEIYMPKPRTFPSLYDDCKTLRVAFLKQHSYLEPDSIKSVTVHWSRNGER